MLYSFFSKELNQNRIFGLDLLRFFAITTVIINHGKFFFPKRIAELQEYIIFDGVTIFFVLSGFLIGGILIKQLEKNKASFRLLLNFWIRRWFRTLPTYFLILLILTLIASYNPSFNFTDIKAYYYFCQNLIYPDSTHFFGEAWSLSVEEWFYLSVPFLIFIFIIFFQLKPKNSILVVALLILFSVTIFRFYVYYQNINLETGYQVIFRLDSIMYGVVGVYISYYFPRYWQKIPNYLLGVGIGVFLIQKYFEISNLFPDKDGLYHLVWDDSFTSLGTLLLLPYLSNFKKTKYKVGNFVTIISLISYSMYLTHQTLIKNRILGNIEWTDFTTNYNIIIPLTYSLYWGVTILVSIFLFKFYELPMTNLRDRFFKPKRNL